MESLPPRPTLPQGQGGRPLGCRCYQPFWSSQELSLSLLNKRRYL